MKTIGAAVAFFVIILAVGLILKSCNTHPAIKTCQGLVNKEINKTRYSIITTHEPIMAVRKNEAMVLIPQVIIYPSGRRQDVAAGCYFAPPTDVDKIASLNKSPFAIFKIDYYVITTPAGTKKYKLPYLERARLKTTGRGGKGYIVDWEGGRYSLSDVPLSPVQLKEVQEKIMRGPRQNK